MQLDHVVINVRADMDAAVIEFGNLGFTITPRGFHTLGSINHLMIFLNIGNLTKSLLLKLMQNLEKS